MAKPFVIFETTAFLQDLGKALGETATICRQDTEQDLGKIVERAKTLIHDVPLPDEGMELKQSMGWKKEAENTWSVGSYDNDHNIFVEFGTHFMAAHPYLRPALLEYTQGAGELTLGASRLAFALSGGPDHRHVGSRGRRR